MSTKQSRSQPVAISDTTCISATALSPPLAMSSRVASEPTSITFASMEEGDSSGGASTSLQLTLGQPTSLSTLVPAGSAATCCPTAPVSAPVYVLSADGSRLWLLDSSRKPLNEEPPAYPTQGRPRSATSTTPRPARQIGIRSFSTPHLQDSSWRSILYGDGADDQEVNERTPLLAPARDSQWKRYWRPIFQRKYWRPLFHLLFINLPLVSRNPVPSADVRTSLYGRCCLSGHLSAQHCSSPFPLARWCGG